LLSQQQFQKKKVILNLLEEYIQSKQLAHAKIGLACSGGVDSIVLLHAFTQTHPVDKIFVLHLDHGWHNNSKQALDLVKSFCDKNSLKFISHSFAQGEMNKSEDDARKARYEFFENKALEHSLDAIFLAHNLNDNIETILFRLFRGTGTQGLIGIPQSRRTNSTVLHRPLLNIARKDIEDYALKHQLEFFEDPSNSDRTYARNRIRHNVIPEALMINQQGLSNIEQLSKLIAEEQAYLKSELDSQLKSLGDLPWSLEDFRKLHRVIQRKLLEEKFTPNISFVNEFLELIEQGGFHRINFKKNKFFTIKQKQIHLEEG
jgi:tRNA(Ile)-lysidine synthetase-like protein